MRSGTKIGIWSGALSAGDRLSVSAKSWYLMSSCQTNITFNCEIVDLGTGEFNKYLGPDLFLGFVLGVGTHKTWQVQTQACQHAFSSAILVHIGYKQ